MPPHHCHHHRHISSRQHPPPIDISTFFQPSFVNDPSFPSGAQRAAAVDASFREHGFLLMRGHGLSGGDMSIAFDMTRTLFAPGPEHNERTLTRFHRKANVGYFPPGVEFLNVTRAPDIKEVCCMSGYT